MLLEKFRGTSHSHKIFTSIEIATPAMNVCKICKLEKQYEIDMWSMMQAEKHFLQTHHEFDSQFSIHTSVS